MNKSNAKVLIPTIIFSLLVIYLSNVFSIWYPAEANALLIFISPSDHPELTEYLSNSDFVYNNPFHIFLTNIGKIIFEGTIWETRWSSFLGWLLLIGILFKGSKYFIGELSAKYVLVIILSCTPLIISTFSIPQVIWLMLWDSLCIISIFHLIDNNEGTKWRILFWGSLLISLSSVAFHTIILVSLILILLPRNYKNSFIINSHFSRYSILVFTGIIGLLFYTYMSVGEEKSDFFTQLLKASFNQGSKIDFLVISGFILWLVSYLLTFPVFFKHIKKGLEAKSGKLYILVLWFGCSMLFLPFEVYTLVPSVTIFFGLSVYALEHNFLSKNKLRIWALIQMTAGVAITVSLMYLVNQQFGFWGILWAIISGIVLLSAIIFFLMMHEAKQQNLAVQGLLSINSLFVLLLFIKLVPQFEDLMNMPESVAKHIDRTNKDAQIFIDHSLMSHSPLIYHLNNEVSAERNILAELNYDEIIDQKHFSYILPLKVNPLSRSVGTTSFSIDTFYLIDFELGDVNGINVLMK